MLFRMLNRFRSDPLRAQVEEAVQAGTGLRKGEWLLAEGACSPEAVAEVAEAIVQWCREQMRGTRTPYGIDQMALAVACAVPGGAPVASATFGVFRPAEFHRENGVGARVSAFVQGLPLDEVEPTPLRFAAALFSWGDVARDTIYRDDDVEAAG